MTRTARLKAYAKLNLGLRVLLKRPDGFHELRTVFQTISLADDLDITYATGRTTHVNVDGTPDIPDNLVEKAAYLVLDELKLTARVQFSLRKQIPSGAGLGGGSSDAAAVLIALPVLTGKHIEHHRLFDIAAHLGSDVPFFLHGGTALGIGRGEELYPLPDQPARRALLVAPDVHSSTADTYRELSPQLTSTSLQNKLLSFQRQVWQGLEQEAVNDFEQVVFARHPEVQALRDRLAAAGARPCVMTGSGSSVFGIFTDPATLRRARRMFPDEKTFAVSFVSRTRYRSAWRRALQAHIVPRTPAGNSRLKDDLWPLQSLYAQ